ncbi:hypothetical protein [Magnetovibrio blakemorei]|nr:hypothetical protein [Magnetovibrio blakemorei]
MRGNPMRDAALSDAVLGIDLGVAAVRLRQCLRVSSRPLETQLTERSSRPQLTLGAALSEISR